MVAFFVVFWLFSVQNKKTLFTEHVFTTKTSSRYFSRQKTKCLKKNLLTVRKTDRANSGVIYETCESSDGPVIFTGHSRNIWVDFVANKNSSGRGFQISFLTIEDELGYLVDAIVNEDKIDSFDGRPTNNNMSLEVSCRGCVIATDFFPV